jgi:L-seryl-tRNA(Ser) seleniumtransferase
MNDPRQIPSVDSLLQLPEFKRLRQEFGDSLVLLTVRAALEDFRNQLKEKGNDFSVALFLKNIEQKLAEETQMTLEAVINASGVLLHTNLGRAVLSLEAQQSVQQAAQSYSNLEFDLEKGSRGSRSIHTREHLLALTGAEDGLVVNNNAAAVLLVLTALASRKQVVISRAQLVEIGGGFRVPDVMKVSGAKLLEVGTTNRVRLQDYQDALEAGAGFVMRAHASNFKIVGFTEQPELADLVDLTHRYNGIFIDDIGSGALLDTTQFGIAHEPMVQESINAGADLVCFSGDKLVGGPQAGIIVGKSELINRIKKHPFARAVRADKLCLAGLDATLLHYLKGEALTSIPVWKMMAMPLEQVKARADSWRVKLGFGEVVAEFSTIGGGSLPGETLPTFVLAVEVQQVNAFLARLRQNSPPTIARIKNNKVLFDPRTILENEEENFLRSLEKIYQGSAT